MSVGIYRNLKSELDKGKKAVVVTVLHGREEQCSIKKRILTEEQLRIPDMIQGLEAETVKKAQDTMNTGTLQYFRARDGSAVLAEPYFPEPRLIVLGGGHIAKPLAEFGAKVGFSVTIVDDRPMFANRDRFPYAEKVICESFGTCFAQFNLNEYSFVVIVTREHRHDLECLKQALNYPTAYTGMIGSKSSVSKVKEQLLNEGYSAELIARVHAPIGLEIGAVTSEEIAVAIIAQVIQYRRLVIAAAESMDGTCLQAGWPELNRSVLDGLCNDTEESKALVTIIETKGSVPRREGTKMLVWSYGMTLGSLGGGYAEGEVINAAWQVIGSGGFAVHDINMTGQTAEEEGMVCGGVMRVLIEDYHS